MNKAELAAYLKRETERFTTVYGGEIVTHAAKAPVDDLRQSLKKRCETRKKPANLVEDEFNQYLTKLKDGTYRPTLSPSEDLWDERNW